MQKAPVLKGSGLAPIDDEPVHVFGRNLEARVVEAREDDDRREDKEKHEDDDVETIKKRKFDTITGEENELTVFQGDFKLFVWDASSSNWIEKGRGQLKLNDDLDEQRSRLIMRISGTFRIILNVAIRHSLFKVISSTKTSIRFSDSQNVWAASGSNAKQLGDLLNDRIAAAADKAQETGDTTKESKTEENETSSAKEKNDAQDVKKQKNEAIDHPARDDENTEVDSNNGGRKDQSSEKDESENNESDEKEEGSGDDEPESQTSHEESSNYEPEKEVADTDTPEEHEGTHHENSDETKKLKLSSD